MIAAWMFSPTAVTLLVFAAAGGIDYLMRAVGVPTRFVWMIGAVFSLTLSGLALARTRESGTRAQMRSESMIAASVGRGDAANSSVSVSGGGTQTAVGRADQNVIQTFLTRESGRLSL